MSSLLSCTHARCLNTEPLQRMVVFSSHLALSGLAPVQSQCELLVQMVKLRRYYHKVLWLCPQKVKTIPDLNWTNFVFKAVSLWTFGHHSDHLPVFSWSLCCAMKEDAYWCNQAQVICTKCPPSGTSGNYRYSRTPLWQSVSSRHIHCERPHEGMLGYWLESSTEECCLSFTLRIGSQQQ